MDVNVKQFPLCVTSFFFFFIYAHKIVDLFSCDTRRRLLVGFMGETGSDATELLHFGNKTNKETISHAKN